MSHSAERSAGANVLIGLSFAFVAVALVVPLALIFSFAFREGVGAYFDAILKPDTLHAIFLTVITAIIVVPINMVVGAALAWLVTRFKFRGQQLLVAIIELPAAVSPIVAGIVYLFLYGNQGKSVV